MSAIAEFRTYMKHNKCFIALVSIFITASAFHHFIIAIYYDLPVKSFEARSAAEIGICLGLVMSFYVLCCSKVPLSGVDVTADATSRILKWAAKTKRVFEKFYEQNVFYSKLMMLTLVGVFVANFHFLQVADEILRAQFLKAGWAEGRGLDDKIHDTRIWCAVKTWEVAAYVTAAIYHYWFWQKSADGEKIQDEIARRGVKAWKINVRIWSIVLLLIGITLFHLFLLNIEKSTSLWSTISGPTSILLIGIVYFLYAYMDVSVVKNCSTHRYKKDFILGLRFVDRPVLIIFTVLFLYSIYTTFTGDFHAVEVFFSGAIAFELLLSSVCWANTKTA